MCPKPTQCTIVIALANVFYGFTEENLQNPWKGKNVDMGNKLFKMKEKKRKEKVALVTKYWRECK